MNDEKNSDFRDRLAAHRGEPLRVSCEGGILKNAIYRLLVWLGVVRSPSLEMVEGYEAGRRSVERSPYRGAIPERVVYVAHPIWSLRTWRWWSGIVCVALVTALAYAARLQFEVNKLRTFNEYIDGMECWSLPNGGGCGTGVADGPELNLDLLGRDGDLIGCRATLRK